MITIASALVQRIESFHMKIMLLSHSLPCFVALNYMETRKLSPQRRTWSKKGLSRFPSFMVASEFNDLQQVGHRRSAHYHPSIWDSKLIDSLSTPYRYESHSKQLEELKVKAKGLLTSSTDPAALLKHIDSMQRLGLAYHFESDIQEALGPVRSYVPSDLHTAALQFRLLRENGFSVTSDFCDKFRSKDGRFLQSLSQDTEVLLSLYEASHLRMPGEEMLYESLHFSAKDLKSLIGKLDSSLVSRVQQSLEIPLYWRVPRFETRNFIYDSQRNDSQNRTLLELAKLDYNLVQSVYQQELKELSQWWRKLDFTGRLSFSRDRLVENHLWAMGIIYEPQFSKCRIGLTKFVCILTAIDDMYDVYGLPHELESFTESMNRWDMKAAQDLPEYMKICYVALHNFVNELVYDVHKDYGLNISPYIEEQWTRLCGSYLVEARWHHRNYVPSMEEYLQNAWISVGGPGMIVHAYPILGCAVSAQTLIALKNSNITYWSSLITRLWDDLGTSKDESKRGDVAKSVECYMAEKGVSREAAEDHVRGLIDYSWMKMNEEITKSSLPKQPMRMLLNMARTARSLFQHGDGIGTSTGETRDRLNSLIVNPIPIGNQLP